MSKIIFGNPHDIKEGTVYSSRVELMEAGLHRLRMNGIDGNATEGAAAIVLSGGYEDDYDYGDDILYTGEGSNDPTSGKQVDHQSWSSKGNAGMLKSFKNNYPIRVIRGFNHNSKDSPKAGYKYCGLYRITEEPLMQIGKSGFKICRFKLRKIGTELKKIDLVENDSIVKVKYEGDNYKQFAIGLKDPNSQTLSVDSKLAQSFMGKKVGDTIELGPGYEIIEIQKSTS